MKRSFLFVGLRFSRGLARIVLRTIDPLKDSPMPNKEELEGRKSADSVQKELESAHYVGAIILLAAAAGFLLLVFGLNRVFDFSRFAY